MKASLERWKLAREYRRAFGAELVFMDRQGRLAAGGRPGRAAGRDLDACREIRRRAIEETLRWGEPCVMLCPAGRLIWAVPLMRNRVVEGAMIAIARAAESDGPRGGLPPPRVRAACEGLLDLAERHNLTNGALLELRRRDAGRERERAEAIHAYKSVSYDEMRSLYLRDEPALLSAIRRGERAAARGIINRILVALYALGGARLDLLKSAALELVVMMCRAAVEAGGEPTALLGINYGALTRLSEVRDEEQLSRWLTDMLEWLLDAIRHPSREPGAVQIGRALRHMREHLGEPLDRDGIARVAGVAPSHFSRLMKRHTGATFTEQLTRLRIERASEMLRHDEPGLAEVALACGFPDQSYFTKVFRKITGRTPLAYRRGAA